MPCMLDHAMHVIRDARFNFHYVLCQTRNLLEWVRLISYLSLALSLSHYDSYNRSVVRLSAKHPMPHVAAIPVGPMHHQLFFIELGHTPKDSSAVRS